MPTPRAAEVVKRRLAVASRRLGTHNPVDSIGGLIDRTFDLSLGDPRYGNNSLLPGSLPLEYSFSELSGNALRLDLEPLGPHASPAARRQEASREMRSLVQRYYGRPALHWFDQQSEPWRGSHVNGAARFGAFFGAAYDDAGLQEGKVYYELGHDGLEGLPPNLPKASPVQVRYGVGSNGLIDVMALDMTSGKMARTTIHRSSGLSDEEVAREAAWVRGLRIQ